MVDCARLEIERAFAGSVGSNPTPSSIASAMAISLDVIGVMPDEQEETQVHNPQDDQGSPVMGDKVFERLEALRHCPEIIALDRLFWD